MPPLTKTEFSVWCEPITRGGKLIIVKGDVTAALEWYRGKFRCLPEKIGLSPVNQYHVEEIPEGVEVEILTGMCSWEIWLSGEKKTEEKPLEEKIGSAEPLEIAPDAVESTPGYVLPLTQGIVPPPLLHKSIKHSKKCLKPKNGVVVAKIPVAKIKKPKKVVRHGIRGRPPKMGRVCRVTLWRRAKKLQGVLV